MATIVGKISWKVMTVAVGIPIGIATKKGVERAWLAARPDNPPRKAKDPYASWRDAISWAALSAIGVAVAQVVTTKGVATVWRSLLGAEPPGHKPATATDGKAAEGVTPETVNALG